jgi:hypothetical protein
LAASGELYAGQQIIIEHKQKGATGFGALKVVFTNFFSKYKLAVKPKKSISYRAVYGGNTVFGLVSSTSPTVLVKVSRWGAWGPCARYIILEYNGQYPGPEARRERRPRCKPTLASARGRW